LTRLSSRFECSLIRLVRFAGHARVLNQSSEPEDRQ
jgi:hypothetical protein